MYATHLFNRMWSAITVRPQRERERERESKAESEREGERVQSISSSNSSVSAPAVYFDFSASQCKANANISTFPHLPNTLSSPNSPSLNSSFLLEFWLHWKAQLDFNFNSYCYLWSETMLAGDFILIWYLLALNVVVICFMKNAFVALLLCHNITQKSNRIYNYLSLLVSLPLSGQISQGNFKKLLSLVKWEVSVVVCHKFIDLPKAFIMNYDN